MERLNSLGFTEPLKEYIRSGKPYFGICLGLQTLFEGSDESPGTAGLGTRMLLCRERGGQGFGWAMQHFHHGIRRAC